MNQISRLARIGSRLRRDRRGVAAVEAALVLPPFLTLLFIIIEVGIYFALQSALDVGILTTGEALRSAMAVGSTYAPPTTATLKSAISTNGGAVLSTASIVVDVRQLSTLAAATTTITDGVADWGSSGSILVVRAQTRIPFLPSAMTLTMTSSVIVRRPSY